MPFFTWNWGSLYGHVYLCHWRRFQFCREGIVTSSVGKMLQVRGFKVPAIKIDPYVNLEAGTMNPYVHGEVYVTDDSEETELDLGWYERFLNINTPKENNITTGQVYQAWNGLLRQQPRRQEKRDIGTARKVPLLESVPQQVQE